MSRALALGALLLASAGLAEGARVAVHPLDARELTVEQREWLKAFFDVRLARTPGVRLAGSNRVDDALRTTRGKDCETQDSCLRYLAESSGSLYAVYARLRREPVGGELLMTARVVRADGAVVKNVSRRAHPEHKVELVDTCRTLVSTVVAALDLPTLPPDMPKLERPIPYPAPPLLKVEAVAPPPEMSARRKAGLALSSVGLATAIAGGVLFALATDDGSRLTPDDTGAVPADQLGRAANVTMQSRAATVLIPVGVIIGLGGALITLWPEDHGVAISLNASPEGGGILVGGRLP